jgi:molybdate transport system ATP-binding protein
MLERLGIAELGELRPTQLSGGQRQRVALARALVLEPDILLLDEPMSALDPRTQREVRGELSELLSSFGGVVLLVTHNPLEALAFGERIAVLEDGNISHLGDREELLRHPRSRYVAELIGVNFLRGRVEQVSDGLASVRTQNGVLQVLEAGLGEDVFVAVEPHAITLHVERPQGTAQNVFRGPIVEIAPEPPYGDRVRVVVDCQPALVAEITAHAVEAMSLRPGVEVYASFKASAARAYR